MSRRSERLDLRVEPELHEPIQAHAKDLDCSVSAAARDLLRMAVTDKKGKDPGWKSGFTEGVAEGFRAIIQCVSAVKNAIETGEDPASITARIERRKS